MLTRTDRSKPAQWSAPAVQLIWSPAMFIKTLVAGAIGAFALATSALANEPFTPQAFANAQSQNQPILVEVAADWCPTCQRQEEVIGQLQDEQRFDGLTVFRVDYDGQRDIVRQFRATTQSTLIVFRGEDETGRAAGITGESDIAALIATAYAD
ncbi:thioredoxin family protein [Synechococcus moorigangaii CMS01]|nr:thioredoxin family protein [Synechococcus moorigangaii CMS01]